MASSLQHSLKHLFVVSGPHPQPRAAKLFSPTLALRYGGALSQGAPRGLVIVVVATGTRASELGAAE